MNSYYIKPLTVRNKYFTQECLKSFELRKMTASFVRELKKVIEHHLESIPNFKGLDKKAIAEDTLEYVDSKWTNFRPEVNPQNGALGYFRLVIDRGIQKSLTLRDRKAKDATAYQLILRMNDKGFVKTKAGLLTKTDALKSIRNEQFDSEEFIENVATVISEISKPVVKKTEKVSVKAPITKAATIKKVTSKVTKTPVKKVPVKTVKATKATVKKTPGKPVKVTVKKAAIKKAAVTKKSVTKKPVIKKPVSKKPIAKKVVKKKTVRKK